MAISKVLEGSRVERCCWVKWSDEVRKWNGTRDLGCWGTLLCWTVDRAHALDHYLRLV